MVLRCGRLHCVANSVYPNNLPSTRCFFFQTLRPLLPSTSEPHCARPAHAYMSNLPRDAHQRSVSVKTNRRRITDWLILILHSLGLAPWRPSSPPSRQQHHDFFDSQLSCALHGIARSATHSTAMGSFQASGFICIAPTEGSEVFEQGLVSSY